MAGETQTGLIKSREGLPVLITMKSANYGQDRGEWWCEPPAPRLRYSIPNPQTPLSLADQLNWLVKAGVTKDDARGRLGRAFRGKQIGYEPRFARSYNRARIDWTTGWVEIPRAPRQKFVPTLLAAEFFSQIRRGRPLSSPHDPDEFDELLSVYRHDLYGVPIDESVSKAATEQLPAAYRFELRDGKIDVLPEPPEPEDRDFALDTYAELVAKVRELNDRLNSTNSSPRVRNSVERLLIALGTQFDHLRPGLLLSCSRSIEADRAAFGDELFADAIAMMNDALQTLRDLLSAFPIVRRIEAERLALDLDRSPDAVPAIREQMDAIKAAVEKSEAVTKEAIGALTQNDTAIEDASDPVVQRGLIADKLLVFRNFAGAVIGGIGDYWGAARAKVGPELGQLIGESWQAIKDELPKGIGAAARVAPLIVLVTMAGVIAGPVGSIASAVPAFKPIADVLKKGFRVGLEHGLSKEKKNGKSR
jgi:hypothetical protein